MRVSTLAKCRMPSACASPLVASPLDITDLAPHVVVVPGVPAREDVVKVEAAVGNVTTAGHIGVVHMVFTGELNATTIAHLQRKSLSCGQLARGTMVL